MALLAQASPQTLCQTGWWRNHSSLWCPLPWIHPGVAHEPVQKSQKAEALANPSPYHSVSIIRNARPKLNHCSAANKITNISTDIASGHSRLWDWRRNEVQRNNNEWEMEEASFDISPDSLILPKSWSFLLRRMGGCKVLYCWGLTGAVELLLFLYSRTKSGLLKD